MTRETKESTLSRWSRRKLEARAEEAPAPIEDDPAALPAEEEGPVLTDADMPAVDSLTEDSDFSGFMSPGVSDELRKLALRKLFRSSVFNIRDGLDEYDEDYTTFEKLGDVVTADMKHQLEIQEQKLREAMEAEAESLEDDPDALEEIEDDEIDAETRVASAEIGTEDESEKHEQ